ncbi:hypothetical protein E2C01_058235 [Portunus trituberculatus]|uniref:Uncharacterized protein n=1 Tax=Portunus trituberculatus TaxID=210409 RepID=A0A5B7H5I7_PORTR|nr:hypothetical protein [Portunus trituberculatus]
MFWDSHSEAYDTRPSLPQPFGLRVANLMMDLSINPTPVYSFRLPRFVLEWLYLLTQRGYRIGFCCVPGHVGVPGNKYTDRLAKEAANRAPSPSPVPFRDIYHAIRVTIAALWQRRWLTGVATSKMGEITTSTLPQWTYTRVRDRRVQILLARLRIGHTYLTQRYLLKRDPQPYCDDCLVPLTVPLTVRHLLVE